MLGIEPGHSEGQAYASLTYSPSSGPPLESAGATSRLSQLTGDPMRAGWAGAVGAEASKRKEGSPLHTLKAAEEEGGWFLSLLVPLDHSLVLGLAAPVSGATHWDEVQGGSGREAFLPTRSRQDCFCLPLLPLKRDPRSTRGSSSGHGSKQNYKKHHQH